MNDFAPVTHPHEYYVDLVKRAPKVPPNQLNSNERKHGHEQFGNNFYLLFLTRLRAERAPDPQKFRSENLLTQVYLNRAETTYAKQWTEFLSHNGDLIKKINTALDGVSIYSEIWSHYRDLLLDERREGSNLHKANDFQALGCEAVGIYAWRQLNPLLEKAADRMKQEGINPQEFFG